MAGFAIIAFCKLTGVPDELIGTFVLAGILGSVHLSIKREDAADRSGSKRPRSG